VATPKISPLSFHAQFIDVNSDSRVKERFVGSAHAFRMHAAIIQLPIHKWQKPWVHQRVILLIAHSAEETKLRLQLEGRIKPGEHILQIIAVGA